ncbi:hypothetical protein [Pseudoruegeria sp. HB172150]|uniref:hypothetical protein n=1 Tax=Pseudoruegeria sp. HB172150 TaxID=2721164 RepID=UPI001552127A|nr:hypothetical protein [Pseudoruegeria sp. HB172150]
MGPAWFLRMKRWAQHPPSWQRVVFVIAIVAVCLALFAYERFFGWPEWLTPNRFPAGRVVR